MATPTLKYQAPPATPQFEGLEPEPVVIYDIPGADIPKNTTGEDAVLMQSAAGVFSWKKLSEFTTV